MHNLIKSISWCLVHKGKIVCGFITMYDMTIPFVVWGLSGLLWRTFYQCSCVYHWCKWLYHQGYWIPEIAAAVIGISLHLLN